MAKILKPEKPQPLPCYTVNGYPVSIQSTLTPEQIATLLGKHAVRKHKGPTVATVKLVPDMNVYEAGEPLFSPHILLGEGFALDFATRTILYPEKAPPKQRMKNLGEQNPLTRTIVFCVALLAEYHGLETVACITSQNQAPLYVHASAVLTQRGALVFCGECTFGKTTISTKLLSDFPLLEDDHVTILTSPLSAKEIEAPRVVVFGDSRTDAAARKKNRSPGLKADAVPLAGIFWLKKDPENAIEPMEQTEAAALMLGTMSNWQHPPSIRHRLQLFRSLFQSVPCQRLAFKKESEPLVEFFKKEGYI